MAQLDVVDLTLALCEIPSLTGDEAAVADVLAAQLRIMGLRSNAIELALGYSAGPLIHADDLALGRRA